MLVESRYNIWKKQTSTYLCANVLYKSVVELTEDEHIFLQTYIEGNEVNPVTKYDQMINELKQQGILITQDRNEYLEIRHEYYKNYYNMDYLDLTFVTTFCCNFNCPYCFENEKGVTLNPASVPTLIKFAGKVFPTKKHVNVSLFGGEPLLNFDMYKSFLTYSKALSLKHGFEFTTSITTNGSLMDEATFDFLVNECNCISGQITLEGSIERHNQSRITKSKEPTLDKLIQTIKMIINKDTNFHLIVRINLLNETISDAEKVLFQFNKEERSKFKLLIRAVFDTDNFHTPNVNHEDSETFIDYFHAQGFVILEPLAYLAFCESDKYLSKLQVYPDLTLDKCAHNFGTSNIGKIDDNGDMQLDELQLAKWCVNSPFEDDVCKKCIYLPLCYGGCPKSFAQEGRRNCFHQKGFDIFKQIQRYD